MPSLVFNLLLLIGSSIILVRSATVLVKAITRISAYYKISEFTVSFLVIAMVTSIPEIAVGINAALDGNSVLALGTALGSNLVDLTLVIAIPTLVAGGIRVNSIIARRDTLFMAVFALVPLLMLANNTISRIDAVILLVFYGLYVYRLISQRTHFTGFADHTTHRMFIQSVTTFVVAVLFLFGASRILVYAASNISLVLDIPILLVGLVLVSAGTSLPELAYELKAVSLKHNDQALGNVLGSVVANSTLVLAITALIQPIQIENWDAILSTVVYLIVVLILFTVGVYVDKEIKVREALVLLLIYFIFLLTEFGLEIIHKANLTF